MKIAPSTKLSISRRAFISSLGAALGVSVLPNAPTVPAAEPIIDIHQHTHYWGRSDEDLLRHQRALGVTRTVLLPAGSKYGLEADCYGNDSVLAMARRYPNEFVFFANEVTDLPTAPRVIAKYLRRGAIGIGEQKFFVACDSPHLRQVAALAQEHDVPVLLHFQHGKYNTGFERFHKVLAAFPRVNFIGHAQTWWANIDRDHRDQTVLYPRGPVTPGGLTDKLLADYPNIYGDLSAGSGLNALLRDEAHARAFLERHQDKLMFGSDCQDADTTSEKCSGVRCLAALRRLVPSSQVTRKILFENARRVLKLK